MFYNQRIHAHAVANQPSRHRRHRLYSLLGICFLVAVLAVLSKFERIDYRTFYSDFGLSLLRVIAAYLISAVIALLLSLLSTRSQRLEGFLLPLLDVAQSFPSFALLPLLVAVLGHNSMAVIIILVIAMIWPILFSLIGAIKTERGDLANAAQIYGAVGVKKITHYRLPMLMPSLMTGSIVAWGEAWDVLVGAEIIAVAGGVGAYLGALGKTSASALSLFLGIGIYLLFIFIINEIIWLPLLRLSSRYQTDD